VFGGFLILSALVALPLLAVRLPPILDYPNHLARMHVLAALPTSPALARYYAASWALIPNLALDAIVPWIARAIPVEAAMKLFTIAMLIATAGGCLALQRVAFARWSIWPLFAFLLLYNRMLLWGFLNYLAGLALVPWALAAWIATERKPAWLRILLGAVLATVIYFAHLAAFGCYALALLGLSLAPTEGRFAAAAAARRAIPALASLVPATALFFASPTSGAKAGIGYGNVLRKFDLLVSIFDNYDRIFDGATFAVILIATIAGLVRGGIIVHPRLRWSLLVLIAAFLATPSRLLSASGLDHRLPVAIAFVFMGATDWNVPARRRRQIALVLFALLAVRIGVIAKVWIGADRAYAEMLPALDMVPEGGALAVAAPPTATQAGGVPLLHFPTLAVMRRDAFVPVIFADPAQQPIWLTAEAASLVGEAVPDALWRGVAEGTLRPPAGYDDLVVLDPPRPLDPASLPGPIVFQSSRLIMIRLPNAPASSAP